MISGLADALDHDQSPLNSATRIKTPLLIVQGANAVLSNRYLFGTWGKAKNAQVEVALGRRIGYGSGRVVTGLGRDRSGGPRYAG